MPCICAYYQIRIYFDFMETLFSISRSYLFQHPFTIDSKHIHYIDMQKSKNLSVGKVRLERSRARLCCKEKKNAGGEKKRRKGRRTTYTIYFPRRELSEKTRGNAKAEVRGEASRRSDGIIIIMAGAIIFSSVPTFPDAVASSRSNATPDRTAVSSPNSRGMYIYKFKMIILFVGVANRGHLRPFSVRSRFVILHPIYRVSGNGGDSDGGGGGGGGGGRQADYAICKNRSRGIPFVIRQEQPCVIRRRGTGKEILRDEGVVRRYRASSRVWD